jgi:hypothetical protein
MAQIPRRRQIIIENDPIPRRRQIIIENEPAPRRRRIIIDNTPPNAQHKPVAIHVHCQPPTHVANKATMGGPANCPAAEPCCIQPTVVETFLS